MAEQFYTILTSAGQAKIANSGVLGTKLNFVKFKVGDGSGAYYNPTESQIDVKNKVWEGNISSIAIDESNPNWIVIETVIPTLDGGFTIREAGIFDDENNLIAIGKYPETYKPVAAEGSSKDLLIRMILEVSNAENINLKVDPTVILATKKDIQTLESKVQLINAQLSDMDYQVAGGTATALTVPMQTLRTGYAKTFIASAANGGAAITINTIPLYKPGTTIPPNLVKDKAYTVWYNLAGNCFFIKASAEGDVIATNVLAGKKFSNDNDTGLIGTMLNNGTLGTSLAINGTYTIPSGYTSGGTVTQSVTIKTAQTYNPSTSAQTIAAGQYLSGAQTIAAITGTATDTDVVAGKTYNSATGILRTGTASIASLGGKKFASGSCTTPNGSSTRSVTVTVGFMPTLIIFWLNGTLEYINCDVLAGTNDYKSYNGFSAVASSITSTGFTLSEGYNSSTGYTFTYLCIG